MKKKVTVDVCIPTFRPGAEFQELLKRLADQDYPIRRLFITNTDRESWDTCLETAYPCCCIRHISRSEFDHGGTRHEMALQSEADLILFLTQDALPADRSLISNLVRAFESPGVAAAYARQLPKPGCSLLEQYTRSFNYPETGKQKSAADLPQMGIKTFFCSDVCAAYDRSIYLELGGFPRPVIFNEDMLFAGRLIEAGYTIAYTAEARVLHSHNYTNRQQFHRNFDLAVSQADAPELFEKYPSEGEGMRLVCATAKHVCRAGKPWLIFPLGMKSAAKYAGYFLGKRYRKLPKRLVRACTTDPGYWERKKHAGKP